MTLSSSLSRLPHITPRHLSALKKLGICTVGDLLRHLPTRYDDFSVIVPIGDLKKEEVCTVEGVVTVFSSQRSWKKRLLVSEAVIEDASGLVRAVWFGQKFLEQTIVRGRRVRLSGKVGRDMHGWIFTSPAFEIASRTPTHTARLVPVYGETYGITSKWLRWQINAALTMLEGVEDPIPAEILSRLHLPSLRDALILAHLPQKKDHYLVARKRFAFEEMFLLQIFSLRARAAYGQKSATKIRVSEKEVNKMIRSLPFTLTGDQQSAIRAICADIQKDSPMNRLLNGDVGSGKTVVAFTAMGGAAQNELQSALLAPTEILAHQHFLSAKKFFTGSTVSLALFTRSRRILWRGATGDEQTLSKKKMLAAVRRGRAHIIIGTHAIIQESVQFHRLALVVVDEQHRFGVAQRAALQKHTSLLSDGISRSIPHLLTMTATPIPRTLAIAFFGNLDISLLETMPAERKPIITRIVTPSERAGVYDFIRAEAARGRQTFIILPLVEESESLAGVKAAVTEHARLAREVFPTLQIGLVHGRLKANEKDAVMRDFAEKKITILVATSVVEVGVDIPNATVMIIEDADRFGLSQLHQFRGRVGRGDRQSYCFLFASKEGAPNARLRALEKSASGFDLAEMDLKLRGPGEFLGTLQSGVSAAATEHIGNIRLVTIARHEAEAVLKDSPSLSYCPILKKTVEKMERETHLE